MAFDPEIHRRRSIRLKGFDYSSGGAYFVTICVQNRDCLFGEIVEGGMLPNDAGKMIGAAWENLPTRFSHAMVDEFVVMPNHFHGILWLDPDRAGTRPAPTGDGQSHVGAPLVGARSADARSGPKSPPALGEIIGVFKSLTTAAYMDGVHSCSWPPFLARLWHRNYFERIIRDEDELQKIRDYIANNPARWEQDSENPIFREQ